MRRTAFRRLLNERPITWLLRDEFSDTRAAGAVNGTIATPGPGVRNAAASNVAIASDEIAATGTGTWGPAGWYLSPAEARVAGKALFLRLKITSSAITWMAGWTSGTDFSFGGYNNNALTGASGPAIALRGTAGSNSPTVFSASAGTYYTVALILRAAGLAALRQSGGNFLLDYIHANGTDATIYPGASENTNAQTITLDYNRVASLFWLPTPLVSDGFGSSFGTTDGLGHAETSGIGSGGGNAAWTQQVGTWANSAGKAAAATLSGGVAVATVPLSTADVFTKVKVTRSAGAGGLTLRWTDSSNYLYAEHDGTNAYLKQVLSGSTTTLITAAATYSAGAEIVVDLNGTSGRLYYNNALVGTTSGINSGLTATAHGLRSTDTGGIQLDDLCIYAKGTGGEYNILNRYINL